jgi:hypothetical protein
VFGTVTDIRVNGWWSTARRRRPPLYERHVRTDQSNGPFVQQ